MNEYERDRIKCMSCGKRRTWYFCPGSKCSVWLCAPCWRAHIDVHLLAGDIIDRGAANLDLMLEQVDRMCERYYNVKI